MKIKNLKSKIHHVLRSARRVKRRLAAVSLIILVIGIPIITYTLSHLQPADAAWWNENWAYRKEIPISAHTAAENNVYIKPLQELAPTTFSGAANTSYQSSVMVDSDSVAI